MNTCFLFANHLSDNGCLSICFDIKGQVLAELNQRTFDEIITLQSNAKTIVVVSCQLASFYQVELPWLAEKKARLALPFALEDQLAESIDDVHIAFDKRFYQNGKYDVVVCHKAWLATLIVTLHNHHIQFDSLTLDWFALEEQEICITDTGLLVHDAPLFSGTLSKELTTVYLNQLSPERTVTVFTNLHEIQLPSHQPTIKIDEDFYTWIGKRLLKHPFIVLNQGSFQLNGRQQSSKRWYWAAGCMTLLWLLSFVTIHVTTVYRQQKDLKDLDNQISVIYHQFFPKAQQVISPRFRIGQLIKSNQGNKDNPLWYLLNHLSETINPEQVTTQQIKYSNQRLAVTLKCKNFDILEALQTELKRANIKVNQAQASSEDNQVVATLELSL